MALGHTPPQTLGPFFHLGLLREQRDAGVAGRGVPHVIGNDLARGQTGERVRIEGAVYDGRSEPVTDALIEIWQADAEGRYPAPLCAAQRSEPLQSRWGFGRCATDDRGAFRFDTIKPGAPVTAAGRSAPHINVIVGARGMSRQAFTRLYFEGDAGLDADPLLALVPPDRRHTLIALCRSKGAPAGSGDIEHRVYRFEIRLQGPGETVFLEF